MSMPRIFSVILTASLGSLFFAGCASSNAHREESRNKVVQTSKMFCEFVNGDNNPDIDIAVNLAIGAKCDADRAFSITNYKTPSEITGILYCCGIREPKTEALTPVRREEAVRSNPVRKAVEKAEKEVPAALSPTEAQEAPAKKIEERKQNPVVFKGDPDLDE